MEIEDDGFWYLWAMVMLLAIGCLFMADQILSLWAVLDHVLDHTCRKPAGPETPEGHA